MRVAVQQEDLQLLARTLQEQLLAQVPSGEVFQIKCAVNKDELMILTQHPLGVPVDPQQIFTEITTALHSLTTSKDQRIQCFVRVYGEKLPYAQSSIILKEQAPVENTDNLEENFTEAINTQDSQTDNSLIFPPLELPISETPITDQPEEEAEEEEFDLLADAPDLVTVKKPKPQFKPILLGIALLVSMVAGAGAYLLTRACVLSECQELQTAQQLKTESRQLTSRAKSENELVAIQQQLVTSSAALSAIPQWSPRYQQAEELKASLSGQAEKINQVVKALQTASVAEQKTQTPANSLEELQARQQLWRQAIAPLETINSNSELYNLVQPRLFKYRLSLQTVNQQLLIQGKWLKKLNDAKAVASVAAKWETTAKSLGDLQKVQSTWQIVINALNIIPPSSPVYQNAQKLLLEYRPKLAAARDRATKEQLAGQTYQQAVSVANQAKDSENRNQWQAAATYWEQALQTAKQISQDTFYYTQAQSLIEPYTAALKQAQEKTQLTNTQQQTRIDLDKTCLSTIRICTYNIDDKGIAVRITSEYEKVLYNQAPDANTQNFDISQHWQKLQEALAVISDNANLPLFVYDNQDKVIYLKNPGA